jgi:hypothetical protein
LILSIPALLLLGCVGIYSIIKNETLFNAGDQIPESHQISSHFSKEEETVSERIKLMFASFCSEYGKNYNSKEEY